MSRYERNYPAISKDEQIQLAQKRVFIAGCGGLGGYVVELLCRTGVGHITVADGDVFTDSNLNRQLLATKDTLGRLKAECAKERVNAVNPEVNITSICDYLTAENVDELIAGHDVIVDALDNAETRLLLASASRKKAGIPLVSGAVAGWYGRVIVLYPTDNADFLWEGGPPPSAGNLAPTVACVASVQSAETVKVLLNRPGVLCGRLLEFDLLSASWDEIELDIS